MNKREIVAILLIVIGISLAARSYQPPFELIPSNARPPINLEEVPDSAFEPGVVRIKLHPEYSEYLNLLEAQAGEIVDFGIAELDALNRELQVSSIRQLFYSEAFDQKFLPRHRLWGFDLWFELSFEQEKDVRQIVKRYFELTDLISWAEPEYRKKLNWTPNDPIFNAQWHYHNTGQSGGTPNADIDLPEAWDIEKGHPNVLVAIIDGGIQIDHPDLSANVWSGVGYNFVNSSTTIIPHGHGTHVAGTVAATNNNGIGLAGIAGGSGTGDGVRMMSMQVFTDDNAGGFHLAPIYAADNGAAISQNSWGYENSGVYNQGDLDAIDYFNTNGGGTIMTGGISIFAAGNDSSSDNWYPAYYSGAFSVAATNNMDQLSYYSNYGTWVDVSAPGGETSPYSEGGIASTYINDGYVYMQGTSMACPHVSGVAALVLSKAHRNQVSITAAELADILRDSVDDISAANPYNYQLLGTGRTNAHLALSGEDPPQPPILITAPLDGSSHEIGDGIQVIATVSASAGNVSRVDFLLDGSTQTMDWSAPYQWNWGTMGYVPGSYEIKAIAYSSLGAFEDIITVQLVNPPDEGFESGDFSGQAWSISGNQPWQIQSSEVYSGSFAAKSGDITHNQSSTATLTLNLAEAGEISFAGKVSSEDGWDFLQFYIDGILQDEWSGELDWGIVSYPVSAGLRTLSWSYSKDGSVSSGSDAAWLDHIRFPALAPPPQIQVSPSQIQSSLIYSEEVETSFTISNTGLGSLEYSIQALDFGNNPAPLSRSIAGSTLEFFHRTYSPGVEMDLNILVYNNSTDAEWLTDVEIQFPQGVTVNSASNFVGESSGTMVPDLTTGEAITINWHGSDTSGYGVIHGNEYASATVNLTFAPDLSGNLSFPYQIYGDVYGAEPHSVSGEITMLHQWFELSPLSGSLAPGGSQQVSVLISAVDQSLGSHYGEIVIESNDPQTPFVSIPIMLEVSPLSPQVVISQHMNGVHLSWDAVPGATSYEIYRSASPAGIYTLLGSSSSPEYTDSGQLDKAFYQVKAVAR